MSSDTPPAATVAAVPRPPRYVARCACGWRSATVDAAWLANALCVAHETWHLERPDLEAADRG
jgi:hypothetical protein